MPQIINNPAQNRFEREENGLVAVADYVLQEKTLVVTHVVVPTQLRGRGVASELAQFIVAFARENGLKIRPQCSFMAAFMERHAETNDLRE